MTQAMSLVVAAGVSGPTLEVTGPESWPQENETWPIHLGMGVTVHARGMFIDAPAGSDVFDVYAYNANDTGTVTIQGYDLNIWVGAFSGLVGVNDNVPNQTALPVVLEDLGINGSSQALSVGPGAQVTLGEGFVTIGAMDATGPIGIYCKGTAANPASVKDVGTGGLRIESHTTDLDIEDYCSVTLTEGPVLGWAEFNNNDSVCLYAYDTTGILAVGNASVTFGSAAVASNIWCLGGNAVEMETSNASGSPTVSVVNATIEYSGCAGARVDVGTFTATSTTFSHNHYGIRQEGGTVNVSGGGSGACTFECADSSEIGTCNGDGIPGIDLLNTTAGTTLTADNALVDSALNGGAPEMWSCSDTTYSSCTCSGSANCPAAAQALPEGADLVSLSTNSAPFSVTNVAGNGSGCP
jgi:hypothetical protein